jgi:hypothetical protein
MTALTVTPAGHSVRWHTGAVSLATAVKAGGMRVDAPADLAHAFGTWGGLSPFATVPRPLRSAILEDFA